MYKITQPRGRLAFLSYYANLVKNQLHLVLKCLFQTIFMTTSFAYLGGDTTVKRTESLFAREKIQDI